MAKTKVHGEFLKDSVVRFTAKAGENITKGQAVYISGVSGEMAVVSLADANDTNKIPSFGLAEATVSTNAEVDIISYGTLKGLNTSSFSLGDILFIGTTAGALTNDPAGLEATKLQNIGIVQRVHATSGSIKVGGAGRTNAVPNLDDGDIFIGDSNNKAISDSFTNVLNSEAGINSSADATAITIDSSENVGIGTSSPNQLLEVAKSSGGATINISTDQAPGSISSKLYTNLDFSGYNNNVMARLQSWDESSSTGYGYLTFHTNNGTSLIERMRINSSGNVGIGNSNPTVALEVGDGTATANWLRLNGTTSDLYIGQNTGFSHFGQTNATKILSVSNHPMVYGTANAYPLIFGTNDTERMRIDSTGNVGIGTSPSYPLHVQIPSDGSVGASFRYIGGTNNPGLFFSTNESTRVSSIDASGSTTGILAFKTSGTEAMRIDSSGNVLVGTTDVDLGFTDGDDGFAVNPAGYFQSARSSTNANLYLNKLDYDGDIIDFRKDGSTVGIIGSRGTGTQIYFGSGDTGLLYVPANDAILPFNTSTNVPSNNVISLGGSGDAFKDLYLSGGAYLGGTGAANHLDDYEEGTWTPAYSSNGGLSTVSGITSASGEYVKIGQFVHITGRFTLNGSSGTRIQPGDFVRITGLPFTVETKYASGTVYTSRAFTNLGGFTGAAYWYAGSYAVIQFLGQGSTTWSGDENETVYFSMNFRDSD